MRRSSTMETCSSSGDDVGEQCWICLAGPKPNEPLVSPCACPRKVHTKCIALWQLHSAGKQEEKRCRFCDFLLPDWRPQLTPANIKPAVPVVSVHYNGVCHRLHVKPGAEGQARFQRQLQQITGHKLLESMQITFQCKTPETERELSLNGISSFDAAIHCASISASQRLAHKGHKATSTNSTSAPAAAASSEDHQRMRMPAAASIPSAAAMQAALMSRSMDVPSASLAATAAESRPMRSMSDDGLGQSPMEGLEEASTQQVANLPCILRPAGAAEEHPLEEGESGLEGDVGSKHTQRLSTLRGFFRKLLA